MLLHWQAVILPFVEQTASKKTIDLKIADRIHVYYMPEERTSNIPAYQCSANPDRGLLVRPDLGILYAFTNYCGVAGIQSKDLSGIFLACVSQNGSAIRFSAVYDGLSNTLMFGERLPNSRGEGYGSWLGSQNTLAATIGVMENIESLNEMHDFEICENYKYGFGMGTRGSKCNWTHHWSCHKNGSNFALCDGSVKFFPYSISEEVLNAMATRDGEEVMTLEN